MSDPNLDELAAELAEFAEPEIRAYARPAKSASLLASRKYSVLSKSMDALHNTAKAATFSNVFTQCASTACGRWKSAVPFLRR